MIKLSFRLWSVYSFVKLIFKNLLSNHLKKLFGQISSSFNTLPKYEDMARI